jgi:GABA permease
LIHVLVIANETAASSALLDALRERAAAGDEVHVTVIAPVSAPRHGYVVYQDTRRASAGRRLEKTLGLLRSSSIPAQGFVVESSPAQAAKDALAQLEPPPDEIVVSTHPAQRSGWLRRHVVDDISRAAGGIPVRHVVAGEDDPVELERNVLVVANETVISKELLDRVRERAAKGPASFLIVAPQSSDVPSPEAARRLRRALSELRSEGIDAHGQVVHPDPFTATMEVCSDERVDEIIVSTFPSARSGWLRRDLVGRLRAETAVPVDHVVSEGAE